DRHALEAEDAEHHQHQKAHDRRHRRADRPGGEGELHRLASCAPISPATARTASPSRRKAAARAITVSPAARPLRNSTATSLVMPVTTLRSATLLSLTTSMVSPAAV